MKKIFILIINLFLFTQLTGGAMENKIKFDGETYNLSVNTQNGYNYYPKGENSDNWHSKITIKKLTDKTNSTESVAEFAHQIQSENPGASVLVYPEAGVVGWLLAGENFYEYNTTAFKNVSDGINTFNYAKRFYKTEFGDDMRNAAINFAEKNNKKYMELVNKETVTIK